MTATGWGTLNVTHTIIAIIATLHDSVADTSGVS
jgi:hypothetical protein